MIFTAKLKIKNHFSEFEFFGFKKNPKLAARCLAMHKLWLIYANHRQIEIFPTQNYAKHVLTKKTYMHLKICFGY